MDTAREIIKESLPIKCLEAVIVSLYPISNNISIIYSRILILVLCASMPF